MKDYSNAQLLQVRIAHASAGELQAIQHRELPDMPGLTRHDRLRLNLFIESRWRQLRMAEVNACHP